MEMERGSIPQVNAAARARGLSYGQYVAAEYYPVIIEEPVAGGEPIVHRAAVPEVLPGRREPDGRGDTPTTASRFPSPCGGGEGRREPVSREAGRKCAVCGGELDPGKKLYCSEECKKKASSRRYYQRKKDGLVKLPPRMPVVEKECAVCGRKFRAAMRHQKYCGSECSDRATKAGNRLRWLAEKEKMPKRQCIACGCEIVGSGYKYCQACREPAQAEKMARRGERYRQRKKEEQNHGQS